MASLPSAEPAYDVIGLGYGPANIAIGGAFIEKWASAATSVCTPSSLYRDENVR